MRLRLILAFALASLASAFALAEDASDGFPAPGSDSPQYSRGQSPWLLGLAVSPEGFGGDLGLPDAERLSLALVLDPFQWQVAVPSVSAGISVPLFPWLPGKTLFEARLDLRVLTLRSKLFESPYDGPSEYAPALTASAYIPLYGGDAFASFGLRPFAFRTGDAVYSLLSAAAVLSRGPEAAAYGIRGFSVELFEFTQFLW
jgi:hypothetical protein